MKTVYAYVVADLLHIGHVRFLRRARDLGDFLTVGVLTTKACMEKKPQPVISIAQRDEMIRALRCVDCVVKQKKYSPLENVKRYRPDILAESYDHDVQPANAWCAKHGIQVIALPYTDGISSTLIKERILWRNERQKRTRSEPRSTSSQTGR